MKRIHLIFAILLCLQGISEAQENEIISRLASVSQRLDWKESDFKGLAHLLQHKKIVALGEATHGTKEFEELFSSLIQFNIEKLGYTAIAFEADFMACQAINDYITLKVDSLDKQKTSGFPMSSERRSTFEWMRTWNENLDEHESPIAIFGLEVRNLPGAITHIVDSYSKLGINTSAIQPFLTTDISQLDKTAQREGITLLEQLLQTGNPLIGEIDRHIVMMALQNIHHQQRLQTAFNKASYIGIRDRSMFENVCWILESTRHKNVILWAHSGHIAKSDIFGKDPTGKYLHDRYKNEYIAIGSTFGSGDVNLFTKVNGQYIFGHRHFEMPVKGDFYEYYFGKVSQDVFFIDLKKAHNDNILRNFFNKKRRFRFIGGTANARHDQKVRLSRLFDVIIHVPTSSLMVDM